MAKALRLTSPPVREKDLQRQIVEGLRWRRYIVLEVGKSRGGVTCYSCGSTFTPTGWQGNTPGTPDLLIARSEWPCGLWLGLELKTAKGRVRPEQKELADSGRVLIVRTWEEAEAAIAGMEKQIAAGTEKACTDLQGEDTTSLRGKELC